MYFLFVYFYWTLESS